MDESQHGKRRRRNEAERPLHDVIAEERRGRERLVLLEREELVDVVYFHQRNTLVCHRQALYMLEESNRRLADASILLRSMRRAQEMHDSEEKWRERQLLEEVRRLKEQLFAEQERYRNRPEKTQKIIVVSEPTELEAVAESYRQENESLRLQMKLLREVNSASHVSSGWLRGELEAVERSRALDVAEAPPDPSNITPLRTARSRRAATPSVASPGSEATPHKAAPGGTPSRLPGSLDHDRVGRQDFVLLRVGDRWSRFYCVLSESGHLYFFNNADDVGKSQYKVAMASVTALRPASSPTHPHTLVIDFIRENGLHTFEVAFNGKNERSQWHLLLKDKIQHSRRTSRWNSAPSSSPPRS